MNQYCINMYNHDDILIVGDSFAQDRTNPTDWPLALSKMLTGNDTVPNGAGIGGTSWWTARKYINKALKNNPPKILVVCHTDALRLPSDKDLGLNSGTVLSQDYDPNNSFCNAYSREEWTAAQMYYLHLMSVDFHNWAKIQWFNELDIMTTTIPIVIHLHCFEQFEIFNNGKSLPSFTFKHGITSAQELFPLQRSAIGNEKDKVVKDLLGFRNHFSPENNVKIAQALYKVIIGFDPANNGTKQYLDLLGQNGK